MQQEKQALCNHGVEKRGALSACNSNVAPPVICFHGSGDNASSGWIPFVNLAQADHKIVLLDRGPTKVSLEEANSALLKHLKEQHLDPPYVLVAHSYGGAFAKMFLYQNPTAVAGMLLVETGQEGGLPENVEESLLNHCLLGNKPLSVVRGNSLITSWRTLQAAEVTVDSETIGVELRTRRQMLEAYDVEDDRLKKAQLRLSTNTRYVHLPDCGHGVIHERPDVVFEDLQWVMANLQPEKISANLWVRVKRRWLKPRS